MATIGAVTTTERGHRPCLRCRSPSRSSSVRPAPGRHQQGSSDDGGGLGAQHMRTRVRPPGVQTAARPAPSRLRVRSARSASATRAVGHRAWLRPHLLRPRRRRRPHRTHCRWPPRRRPPPPPPRAASTRRLCMPALRTTRRSRSTASPPVARPADDTTHRRHRHEPIDADLGQRPGHELRTVALDDGEGHGQPWRRGRPRQRPDRVVRSGAQADRRASGRRRRRP